MSSRSAAVPASQRPKVIRSFRSGPTASKYATTPRTNAIIGADAGGAGLDITTGDSPYADIDTIRRVSIVATRDYGIVGMPSRRAFVEVNGVELAVPQPAG